MTREQIAAYLERMGYTGTVEPTKDCLNQLMWAHLTHIPFENLDVYEGRIPSLNPDDLHDRIVVRKRGGYCFELNGLFFCLLKALGFDLYATGVRLTWRKPCRQPVLHRGSIVRLEGKHWFCDVGYGGPSPRRLLALEEGVQELDGKFLVQMLENGWWELLRDTDGKWETMMEIDPRPAEEEDFLPRNLYCATAQVEPFRNHRMINLTTETGSLAMTDDVLTIRDNGQVTTIAAANDEERLTLQKQYFGL